MMHFQTTRKVFKLFNLFSLVTREYKNWPLKNTLGVVSLLFLIKVHEFPRDLHGKAESCLKKCRKRSVGTTIRQRYRIPGQSGQTYLDTREKQSRCEKHSEIKSIRRRRAFVFAILSR